MVSDSDDPGAAFWRVEREGARLGLRVRCAGLLAVAAALTLRASGPTLAWYLGVLAALALTGVLFYATVRAPLLARSRLGAPLRAGLVLLDMALATFALVVPAPTMGGGFDAPMQLRIADDSFLYLFLALSAMSYSPALALWSGAAAAGAWLTGALWVLAQPGAFTLVPADFAAMDAGAAVAALTDPAYVSIIGAAQQALLLLVVGAALAAAVWRGRMLALRQVRASAERATLLRYFSPDLAAELTHRRADFDTLAVREAGVMFADIFGFTAMAETMTPEQTIAFLREFHRRSTAAVFAHGGTLNKFIGDEVMASFGAIQSRPDAPAMTLQCAVAVAETAAAWSADRQARGLPGVRVGVGAHVGPVVVGDIGDARCLELAVLGDVVNTANRLQHATRAHDVCIVASAALLEAAVAARPDLAPLAARFEPLPLITLRGRRGAVASAGLRWAGVGAR